MPPKVFQRFHTWLAILLVVPALLVSDFSKVFLSPKLNQLCKLSELSGSWVQWLVDASVATLRYAPILAALGAGAWFALEKWKPAWRQARQKALLGLAALFQTAVLLGVTALACAALCTALLATSKAKAPKPAAGAASAAR